MLQMRKLLGWLLIGAPGILAAQTPQSEAIFDFSAIDAFRRVVEILEADENPTEAQWSALLDTLGYQALTASEFTEELTADRTPS